MSERFTILGKPVTSPAKVYDLDTDFEILCYNADKVCDFLNDLVGENKYKILAESERRSAFESENKRS